MNLTDTARAQAGVFSRPQALANGFSSGAVERRLASGEWRRALPGLAGVYAHAATTLVWESGVWAAVLAVGDPCAVAVTTAASVWGWASRRSGPVELVVPPHRYLRPVSEVRIRRLKVEGTCITTRSGLPVTTRARTLADCLRFLPEGDAVDVLDRAQQVHGISLKAVAGHLPGRGRGSGQARRLLAAAGPERFAAERTATALLRRAGVSGWTVNHRLVLDGRVVVIDIAFIAAKLAVEIDGWAYHSDVDAFRRDRRRQNLLVGNGWRVLRFTYHDLVDRPDDVVAQIRSAACQSTD